MLQSSRRLIIFGCGYVGRALARETVRQGWETWIHSRNGDSLASVSEVPEARRVLGNLHESGWHGRLTGHWDAVVNLVSSAGGGIDGYRLSYLEGNRSIREWARSAEVGRFIYSSATSVYPQTDGSWVTEADVPESEHLSANGRILRESELEILSSDVFREAVIARLAGIYGPGRHLYLNRLREGATSIPGNGATHINLIHLKDIVRSLIAMLDTPLPSRREVFNVVDDAPCPKQAIVDWLAHELGIDSISFDPSAAGSRTSRRATGSGLPDRRVSNAKLKKVTNWTPCFPDFRAGYRDILAGQAGPAEDS
jgi:nucleoside-diphosphate-sugar epimerase